MDRQEPYPLQMALAARELSLICLGDLKYKGHIYRRSHLVPDRVVAPSPSRSPVTTSCPSSETRLKSIYQAFPTISRGCGLGSIHALRLWYLNLHTPYPPSPNFVYFCKCFFGDACPPVLEGCNCDVHGTA